jgi:hypothetical protein
MKNLSWLANVELRLLERDGMTEKVLLSRGALDQNVWSGKNILGKVELDNKKWYVEMRTPRQKKMDWIELTAVLTDHCNEVLWYIYHTCEHHKDKRLLVEALDSFVNIRTLCNVKQVHGYMRSIFNIEDGDNWMHLGGRG